MNDEFAILILTHGRADNVMTTKALEKSGYTGKIYYVIDDEDEQENLYYAKYGDSVIKFNKKKAAEHTDVMTPSRKRNAVVFARNECWRIAEELGLTHFCVLDDDYKTFGIRYIEDGKFKEQKIKKLDEIIAAFCEFLDVSGAITVCMAQGGDYIGGVNGGFFHKGLSRKAMNVWFMRTDRPFKYIGLTNEDTNMYVSLGGVGKLMFTVTNVSVNQVQTQDNPGGLTDIYKQDGTFVKSFYSVMCRPDCVKVAAMGNRFMRMHHNVEWDYCVPQIINEKWQKGAANGENGKTAERNKPNRI